MGLLYGLSGPLRGPHSGHSPAREGETEGRLGSSCSWASKLRGRAGGAGPGRGLEELPALSPPQDLASGPLKEINSTPRGNFNEKQKLQSKSIQKISVESFSLAHDKKLYKTVRFSKAESQRQKKGQTFTKVIILRKLPFII